MFSTHSLTLTPQEGQTGKVTITDFKPADIDFLLNFIYTGVINLRKSYPGETWSALIKIWKMADFFCLDTLRDLVIAAAKDHSLEIARVVCAFEPPDGHDQKITRLFGNEFVPAVKAIYEDEMESIKHHFAPIILGLAVASVHRFSQIAGFEKLLQDIPQFAADWAAALMKGLPQPSWDASEWGYTGKCTECNRLLKGSGVIDTFSFMRQYPSTLCRECYKGPDLELWKNPPAGGWN